MNIRFPSRCPLQWPGLGPLKTVVGFLGGAPTLDGVFAKETADSGQPGIDRWTNHERPEIFDLLNLGGDAFVERSHDVAYGLRRIARPSYIAPETEYLVSPYFGWEYRFSGSFESHVSVRSVYWDRSQKKLKYPETFVDGNGDLRTETREVRGIASEDDFYAFFGGRWREEAREAIREAVKQGLTITREDPAEHLRRQGGRWRVIEKFSGGEANLYLIDGRRLRPHLLKVYTRTGASSVYDNLLARCRYERVLKQTDLQAFRVLLPKVVGPNWELREWIEPRWLNFNDADHDELQALRKVLSERARKTGCFEYDLIEKNIVLSTGKPLDRNICRDPEAPSGVRRFLIFDAI